MIKRIQWDLIAFAVVCSLAIAWAVSASINTVEAQTEVRPFGSQVLVAGSTPLTTVAVPISVTSVPVREVILQCEPVGGVDCYFGNSTTQTLHILAGATITISVANLQLIYAKTASTTATVNYLGRF